MTERELMDILEAEILAHGLARGLRPLSCFERRVPIRGGGYEPQQD